MKLTHSMQLAVSNRKERAWWTTYLWGVGLFLLGPLITMIPFLTAVSLLPSLNQFSQTKDFELFINLLGFPGILIGALLINRYFYHHPVQSLGFFRQDAVKKYLFGALLGMLAIAVIYLINLMTGSVHTVIRPSVNGLMFVILIILFGIQGMTEEVVTKGLIMNKVSRQKGIIFGVISNALFFSLLHGLNPGINLISLVNLFLAGITFSLIFYWSDNIWLTGAVHSLWNITLGMIFGSEVSGQVLDVSLMKTTFNHSMTWMNGGHFGLEGGMATTVATVLFSVILRNASKNKY